MYELNSAVNKPWPDPRNLKPGQGEQYGRKSTANERSAKSLADQRTITQAIAVRYGLPSDDSSWAEEAAGLGGDIFWEGGGHHGLDVPDPKRKTRPVLTAMLRRVMAGETKCITVISLCRLWRSVSLCQGILTILYDNNCLLFDASGPVNLWSFEGRNAVLQNAIAAQAVSENARVRSPIGVFANLEAGVLATSPNLLGFRTAGRGTKKVKHMVQEQALVNRIYQLFDAGQSDEQIAHLFMAEGIQPYFETGGKHPCGNDRAPGNEMVWRTDHLHDILLCPKYVGMQRHRTEAQKKRGEKGTDYPCAAFLREVERDGKLVQETVVPRDLWDRVQRKMESNARIGYRGLNYRALSSLVRCGTDGESLTAQDVRARDGSYTGYWIMRGTRPGCLCRCRVPTVREATLSDYLADVMGPLMLAEINDRAAAGMHDPHLSARTRLQQDLKVALDYRNGRLLQMLEDDSIDPALLKDKSREIKMRIERLEQEITALVPPKQGPGEVKAAGVFADLHSAPEEAVRDAIRQCLCWIAVIPVNGEREPKPGYLPGTTDIRYSYAPATVAKLVFLTAWGTYHCAILHRERNGIQSGAQPFTLRPATPEETLGGVADFPDPQRFVRGLERAWAGRVYRWAAEKFAPGWSEDPAAQLPVAEFDLSNPPPIKQQ